MCRRARKSVSKEREPERSREHHLGVLATMSSCVLVQPHAGLSRSPFRGLPHGVSGIQIPHEPLSRRVPTSRKCRSGRCRVSIRIFQNLLNVIPSRGPHCIRRSAGRTPRWIRRYHQIMQINRIVQDSGNVEKGHRLIGNIRAFLYIGAAVFLAIVVYVLNHYR